jgi:hypothetical protein
MKKVLFSIVCIIMVTHSFCQVTATPLTKEDYLKKSKNQKTAAWVMLIGGTVLTTIGVGVALGSGLDCAYGVPDCDNNQTLPAILTITGGAAMLGSIPLFIVADKNKKKAMSAVLIIEKMPAIRFSGSVKYQSYPAISLRLPLGKSK